MRGWRRRPSETFEVGVRTTWPDAVVMAGTLKLKRAEDVNLSVALESVGTVATLTVA